MAAKQKRTSFTPIVQFRANETDTGAKVLEGYFIRFDEETNLFEDYFETVAPEAIADDIQEQDIRALFDHDSAKVLGRTTAGTLTLRKDEQGLFGSISINENDPEALSIYAKVQRGDISSASFGFWIRGDDMTQDETGYHDRLTDVELIEISVVAFPAYPTTEIGARSNDIESFKQQKLAQRKTQLKNELQIKWKIQLS